MRAYAKSHTVDSVNCEPQRIRIVTNDNICVQTLKKELLGRAPGFLNRKPPAHHCWGMRSESKKSGGKTSDDKQIQLSAVFAFLHVWSLVGNSEVLAHLPEKFSGLKNMNVKNSFLSFLRKIKKHLMHFMHFWLHTYTCYPTQIVRMKTQWAASFIGLNLKNPWEGRPVCLSFRVRSELTNHPWLSVATTKEQNNSSASPQSKWWENWNVCWWCAWIYLKRLVLYCVCGCGELSSQRFVSGACDVEKTKPSVSSWPHLLMSLLVVLWVYFFEL